jgi:hypothetical protein
MLDDISLFPGSKPAGLVQNAKVKTISEFRHKGIHKFWVAAALFWSRHCFYKGWEESFVSK